MDDSHSLSVSDRFSILIDDVKKIEYNNRILDSKNTELRNTIHSQDIKLNDFKRKNDVLKQSIKEVESEKDRIENSYLKIIRALAEKYFELLDIVSDNCGDELPSYLINNYRSLCQILSDYHVLVYDSPKISEYSEYRTIYTEVSELDGRINVVYPALVNGESKILFKGLATRYQYNKKEEEKPKFNIYIKNSKDSTDSTLLNMYDVDGDDWFLYTPDEIKQFKYVDDSFVFEDKDFDHWCYADTGDSAPQSIDISKLDKDVYLYPDYKKKYSTIVLELSFNSGRKEEIRYEVELGQDYTINVPKHDGYIPSKSSIRGVAKTDHIVEKIHYSANQCIVRFGNELTVKNEDRPISSGIPVIEGTMLSVFFDGSRLVNITVTDIPWIQINIKEKNKDASTFKVEYPSNFKNINIEWMDQIIVGKQPMRRFNIENEESEGNVSSECLYKFSKEDEFHFWKIEGKLVTTQSINGSIVEPTMDEIRKSYLPPRKMYAIFIGWINGKDCNHTSHIEKGNLATVLGIANNNNITDIERLSECIWSKDSVLSENGVSFIREKIESENSNKNSNSVKLGISS